MKNIFDFCRGKINEEDEGEVTRTWSLSRPQPATLGLTCSDKRWFYMWYWSRSCCTRHRNKSAATRCRIALLLPARGVCDSRPCASGRRRRPEAAPRRCHRRRCTDGPSRILSRIAPRAYVSWYSGCSRSARSTSRPPYNYRNRRGWCHFSLIVCQKNKTEGG